MDGREGRGEEGGRGREGFIDFTCKREARERKKNHKSLGTYRRRKKQPSKPTCLLKASSRLTWYFSLSRSYSPIFSHESHTHGVRKYFFVLKETFSFLCLTWYFSLSRSYSPMFSHESHKHGVRKYFFVLKETFSFLFVWWLLPWSMVCPNSVKDKRSFNEASHTEKTIPP